METDIAINPEILFDPEVKGSDLKLSGIALNDSWEKIKAKNIMNTSLVKYPGEIDLYKEIENEKKVYVVKGQKEIEYPLKERIKTVAGSGGYLYTTDGNIFGIVNGCVTQLILSRKLLSKFKTIRDQEIEKLFGKADEITETFLDDVELFSTPVPDCFIYHKKQMKIYWKEGWESQISSIQIGEDIPKDKKFKVLSIVDEVITYTYDN